MPRDAPVTRARGRDVRFHSRVSLVLPYGRVDDGSSAGGVGSAPGERAGALLFEGGTFCAGSSLAWVPFAWVSFAGSGDDGQPIVRLALPPHHRRSRFLDIARPHRWRRLPRRGGRVEAQLGQIGAVIRAELGQHPQGGQREILARQDLIERPFEYRVLVIPGDVEAASDARIEQASDPLRVIARRPPTEPR